MFVRNLNVLESLSIEIEKFEALKTLEFCNICSKVLELKFVHRILINILSHYFLFKVDFNYILQLYCIKINRLLTFDVRTLKKPINMAAFRSYV